VEKGSGRQFSSKDRRAQLAVYTLMNRDHDTPASYLRKHLRVNAGVFDYRRVTSRFLLSQASGVVQCSTAAAISLEANSPASLFNIHKSETKAWDRVVTRMSLSLR
jgi:hypothetical protein